MKPFINLIIFSFSALSLKSQFSGPLVIDDEPNTAGVLNMAATDISNNGLNDLIVAQGTNEDRLVIYWNSERIKRKFGMSEFSTCHSTQV